MPTKHSVKDAWQDFLLKSEEEVKKEMKKYDKKEGSPTCISPSTV